MFSKVNPKTASTPPMSSPKPEMARAQATGPVPPSIIATDMRIVGELVSQGDLQIDGQVEGDIRSKSVTIGEGAAILGSLKAETVRICGAVTGEIDGDTVMLTRTARVIGDILSRTLSIEPGAMLDGRCRNKEQGTVTAEARPFVVHSGKESAQADMADTRAAVGK